MAISIFNIFKQGNTQTRPVAVINKDTYDYGKIVRNILQQELTVCAAAIETDSCHIKIGDTAIINKYEIGYLCNNGWDGGPNTLLSNVKSIDFSTPVTVLITGIFTESSLAEERIERFIDQCSTEELMSLMKSKNAIAAYQKYLTKICGTSGIFRNFMGLYKTATFKIEGSFQPRWSLNVGCFLPLGSFEYNKTYSLWSQEMEIDNLQKEIYKHKEEIDAKKRIWDNSVSHLRKQ